MNSLNTIDTRLAKQLQQACALRGCSIIGVAGGWSVLIKVGMSEKPLGTQRTGRVRQWRSLDTLMEYLRDDLGIVKVDGVDASGYSAESVFRQRPDVAGRMKVAHGLLDAAVASTRRATAAVDQAMDKIDASNQRLDVRELKGRVPAPAKSVSIAAMSMPNDGLDEDFSRE